MGQASEIIIKVDLDENKVPDRIEWKASDMDMPYETVKATMLSMWDPKAQNTLRIDLWNKEMSVEEMNAFFHQSLVTMADTFERATGNKNLCEDMRDFCFYFAKKTNLIPEDSQ